jgi:uncharacterized DUF497 family protein
MRRDVALHVDREDDGRGRSPIRRRRIEFNNAIQLPVRVVTPRACARHATPVNQLRFARDLRKASANLREHGVTSVGRKTVFAAALLLDDPGHTESEDRSVMLGLRARLRFLSSSWLTRFARADARFGSSRRAKRRSAGVSSTSSR